MIFRQLFEPESSTYTYFVACQETRQAVLVDPVLETVDRDLAAIQDLDLTLAYRLDEGVDQDEQGELCEIGADPQAVLGPRRLTGPSH